MRNVLGMAIAAVLLVTVPAGAQMHRVPMAAPRARPMRLPNRAITYSRPRPAPPRVRVVYVNPAATSSRPQRPAIGTNPLYPFGSSTNGPFSPTFSGAGGTPIPLGQLLNPTPGLGFDFNHLAAVNNGLAVRAFIDPVTEHELAIVGQLPQVQPVGFFPTYAAQTPVVIGAPQPQIIVLQQPAPQPAAASAPVATPALATAAPAAPPLPVGDLYLVRHDGGTIKVVAFTRQGGEIVYITPEGLRRSIALDQLDIQATEQRNAERGTILHLTD